MQARLFQTKNETGLTIRFGGAEDPSLVGLFVVQNDVFRYVNTEFASLLGYRTEDLINRCKLRDIVAPSDWLGIARIVQQVETGTPRALQASFTGRGKNGCCTPAFEAFFYCVEDQTDRSLLGMVHDVTANQRLANYLEHIRHSETKTIYALARICMKRDPYTDGHQERVSNLAVAIARELGIEERCVEGLALGARIHDIGKIYIPSEILNRPGRLTSAEYEVIKAHSEVGFEIVKDIDFPWPIGDIILQHHERMDGSGYPKGLKGEEIILEARILAVADTVEAMSAHRPYRPALGVKSAMNLIGLESGRLYDSDVAQACLKLFRDGRFTDKDFTEGPPKAVGHAGR